MDIQIQDLDLSVTQMSGIQIPTVAAIKKLFCTNLFHAVLEVVSTMLEYFGDLLINNLLLEFA